MYLPIFLLDTVGAAGWTVTLLRLRVGRVVLWRQLHFCLVTASLLTCLGNCHPMVVDGR